MDLNIENYTDTNILEILNISNKTISINLLQKSVSTKITEIINLNDDDLPESREDIIEFFMECYFKCFNKIKNDNISNNLNRYNEMLLQHKNDVINENNNFIINNKEQDNVNSFNIPIKKGIINPLTIKTLQQVVNINSKFRDNYNTTNSSDFSILLPSPLKKVINMKLLNYNLPKNVYSVSNKLGSNTFVINDTEIILENGSYNDPRVMVEVINKKIQQNNLNIEIVYNKTNGTMYFVSLDENCFSLDFNTNNNVSVPNNVNRDHLTLGWMLGFRGGYLEKTHSLPTNKYIKNKSKCCNEIKKNNDFLDNYYCGKTKYIGDSIFDNYGNNYFLLSINDYQNNHNSIFISPFKYQSNNDNNILAKINLDNKCIDYPNRIYFGPTDIAKLSIKLYDEYGRIIDNNNADYSIEILCELIYDN